MQTHPDRPLGRRLLASLLGSCFLAIAAIASIQTPAQAGHLSTVTWGAGAYEIARDYEHTYWEGPFARRTYTNSSCTNSELDVDTGGYPGQFSVDHHGTLAESNWNNEISSIEVSRGCGALHWDSQYCQGGDRLSANTTAEIGPMNDRTSCIYWT